MAEFLGSPSSRRVAKLGVLTLAFAAAAAAQSPFIVGSLCAGCHTDLAVPDGAVDQVSVWTPHRLRAAAKPADWSAGPGALWAGSMMAHSAVDPYWKAKVKFESASTPAAAAVIENACLSCHAPMQQYAGREQGRHMRFSELNDIGRDGVSCTVCHQIEPDNLGTKASFSAQFKVNSLRRIYGPHENPFSGPMVGFSGFEPVASDHITRSELCASCHTVITPTLNEAGQETGEFIEQAPYLEWLASDFPAEDKTCQSCHLPPLRDANGNPAAQYIAHTPARGIYGPTNPRTPFGQHFFLGVNTQVLGMLRELFPERSATLSAAQDRTRRNLREAVELHPTATLAGGRLNVEVELVNRTGHKLPTAYPSRRMWVYVAATNSAGETFFESGALDAETGEIRGLDGAVEPHHDRITRSDQVAVYESEMADSGGRHTVTLMRGAGYVKDNRILPRGFDLARPQPDGIDPDGIAPVGVAGDANFLPGSDTVTYEIAPSGSGPYRVTVRVYYQSIKESHLEGMQAARSAEEAQFLGLFPRHNSPTLMREQILVAAQ